MVSDHSRAMTAGRAASLSTCASYGSAGPILRAKRKVSTSGRNILRDDVVQANRAEHEGQQCRVYCGRIVVSFFVVPGAAVDFRSGRGHHDADGRSFFFAGSEKRYARGVG